MSCLSASESVTTQPWTTQLRGRSCRASESRSARSRDRRRRMSVPWDIPCLMVALRWRHQRWGTELLRSRGVAKCCVRTCRNIISAHVRPCLASPNMTNPMPPVLGSTRSVSRGGQPNAVLPKRTVDWSGPEPETPVVLLRDANLLDAVLDGLHRLDFERVAR